MKKTTSKFLCDKELNMTGGQSSKTNKSKFEKVSGFVSKYGPVIVGCALAAAVGSAIQKSGVDIAGGIEKSVKSLGNAIF